MMEPNNKEERIGISEEDARVIFFHTVATLRKLHALDEEDCSKVIAVYECYQKSLRLNCIKDMLASAKEDGLTQRLLGCRDKSKEKRREKAEKLHQLLKTIFED